MGSIIPYVCLPAALHSLADTNMNYRATCKSLAPTAASSAASTAAEGGAAQGKLKIPRGVAVDGDGSTTCWPTRIEPQVFSADGSFVRCFGSLGELKLPRDVAVDGDGNYVVADKSNHRVQVFGVKSA